MIHYLLLLFTLIVAPDLLQARYVPQDYPWIEASVWPHVQKHLLPEDHPAKKPLDKIFGKQRATASVADMKKAGFQMRSMHHKRKVIAKHPQIKGYLIKTYLDCHQINMPDWKLWRHRIKGAHFVKATLNKYGFNHIMKVPHKWLYPLPLEPQEELDPHGQRRDFILVVEDMHPLRTEQNKKQYKKITEEQLHALFIVLNENLLHDSIYIHNIPFCKDGKIAFLDLEHHSSTSRRVRYELLTPYFPSKMKLYWQTLITNKT